MASTDIGGIVKNISDDVKLIVQSEIELAKAEIVPQVKRGAKGSAMFLVAGYFAMCMLGLLGMAGGFGFGDLFQQLWDMRPLFATALGFCAMALVLLIVAVILVLIGKASMKFHGPDRTIAEGKATVEHVKGAIARGKNDVALGAALERARHGATPAERG